MGNFPTRANHFDGVFIKTRFYELFRLEQGDACPSCQQGRPALAFHCCINIIENLKRLAQENYGFLIFNQDQNAFRKEKETGSRLIKGKTRLKDTDASTSTSL